MPPNKLFQEAKKALIEGDYQKGKKLLSRLIREDRTNDTYWYYLSASVNTRNEQIRCLKRVLELNSNHDGAKRALIFLGVLPPDENVEFTKPPSSKQWKITPNIYSKPKDEDLEKDAPLFENLFSTQFIRGGIYIALLIVFIITGTALGWFSWDKGYILPSDINAPLSALYGTNTPTLTPTNTNTPTITPSPTFTQTPTMTPIVTYSGPTFTPTPYYVGTPHPDSDAYISGMDSFENNRWMDAVSFFTLHLESNPGDVDVMYYRGLAYLYNGDNSDAKTRFAELIGYRPDFAPGYYGYALSRLAQDPKSDVLDDLNDAIIYDKDYLEAYLLRAEFFIREGNSISAAQDANKALELNPNHAIALNLLAQTMIMEQEYQQAYDVTEQSLGLDPTYIASYKNLGITLVELGRPLDAERPLEIYLLGYPEDAAALMYMGVVAQANGDHQSAIALFAQAKGFDYDLWKTIYYRGVSYLALDDYLKALDDLILANEIFDNWYDTYLNLSIGYYYIGEPALAMNAIRGGRDLAESEYDFATLYYWRGIYSDAAGNSDYAKENMQLLMGIPDEFVPEGWKEQAQNYIDEN